MGIGVPKNYTLAFELLKSAAEGGIPEAQCFLGMNYSNGYGCEQNIDKAIYWLNIASRNGFPTADMALEQLGVQKNN